MIMIDIIKVKVVGSYTDHTGVKFYTSTEDQKQSYHIKLSWDDVKSICENYNALPEELK